MDVKLRTLEIFRLFASTQNVTETAKALRISQPAVSHTLRDLEKQIGLSLFKRVGNRLQLTPEAQNLLPFVERLIAQTGALKNHVSDLQNEQAGHLAIAAVPTLTHTILPQAVTKFRVQRSQVRLRIGSFTAADIVRQIRLENADIGLTFLPINDAGVRIERLLRTAMVCMAPKGHRLCRLNAVTAADLENDLVIAQGPETPPGFILRDYLAKSSVPELNILEVNQAGVALPLVAHGVGIALAHPLVLPSGGDRIVAIPFVPKVELTLALLYPKYATPSQVAANFVKILRQELADQSEKLSGRGLPCSMLSS